MVLVRKLLAAMFLITLCTYTLIAQISPAQLSTVKVDALTDVQIKDFVTQYKASGYTLEDVERSALQGGMSVNEWQKMKARISLITSAEQKQAEDTVDELRLVDGGNDGSLIDERQIKLKKSGVFGTSLFNNSKISFEPNLRLATPENYILGVDDEVIVDIYGLSESTYQLRVSPEGFIRIPMVGPVQVNGLTIDHAKKKIINQLASVYTTINTNETKVSISLGAIRSIKVILIGEVVQPGTYTLPSVASVFNALTVSGGPNDNGSFRSIRLIRNNKEIAKIDIYDFLTTGILKNNLTLQDQDVIKIDPYIKRVELEGEVKNVGLFEAIENESLAQLLMYAGGFTTKAYKDQITVLRNTSKEKSISNVVSTDLAAFKIESGDHFIVGELLDRFLNRVEIVGSVYRPGMYSIEDGLTVKGLIAKADGITEDAFLHRAIITRERNDRTKEMLSFDLGKLLNGEQNDIVLKKEDQIIISSVLEMNEVRSVSVWGEVMKDGNYPFREGMSLKDLLFLAGGFNDRAEAQEVEVSRIVTDPDILKRSSDRVKTHKFSLDKNLSFNDEASNFSLSPHDHVVVRPISGLEYGRKIKLSGEVFFPGSYIITGKDERISDVIKRAGGLNQFAYPDGAYLLRSKRMTASEKKLDKVIFMGVSQGDTLVDAEKFYENEGIVGIDLAKILKTPGSKWDLLLEENDEIHVPKNIETVQVSGEVFIASYIRYDKSMSFKDYVNQAGGFSSKALKRKSFVVHANGMAMGTKKILIFNKYPKINPGSQLYIPKKHERKTTSSGESIAIATSATSMAAMLVALFNNILN